jgi:hypothetical protein
MRSGALSIEYRAQFVDLCGSRVALRPRGVLLAIVREA